jgi:hypothetical protein
MVTFVGEMLETMFSAAAYGSNVQSGRGAVHLGIHSNRPSRQRIKRCFVLLHIDRAWAHTLPRVGLS